MLGTTSSARSTANGFAKKCDMYAYYRCKLNGLTHDQIEHTLTVRLKASGVWKESLDFSNKTFVMFLPSHIFPSCSACNLP